MQGLNLCGVFGASEMGFSAASPKPLGHCFFRRHSDHRSVQFQSFKCPPRRTISCKLESMEFEERMSPNEVLIYIYVVFSAKIIFFHVVDYFQ